MVRRGYLLIWLRLPEQSEDPTSCAPALQLCAPGDHGQKFAREQAVCVTWSISNWQKIRVSEEQCAAESYGICGPLSAATCFRPPPEQFCYCSVAGCIKTGRENARSTMMKVMMLSMRRW